MTLPDLIVVAIDANCSPQAQARKSIAQALRPELAMRVVIACPDPHVERWYLADAVAFSDVVGSCPRIGRKKCKRDHYKQKLAQAVLDAKHPPTLGGIEFAAELVRSMDLHRAGKADPSLRRFIADLRSALKHP